jgi:hypothetical protein
MKTRRNFFGYFKVSPIIFIMVLILGCSSTNAGFQKDADIIRLQHLKFYGELLEEYFKIKGNYPFQGENSIPTYVYIANDEQIESTKPGPPYSHKVISFKKFVDEVESVLGREINEYYDPQYRPDKKPNFYMYLINGDTFFFAINIHQPFPFTRKVGEDYYKVEISNHPTPQNKAAFFQQLINNPEIQAELNKQASKEGFFKEREIKYLHFTKSVK